MMYYNRLQFSYINEVKYGRLILSKIQSEN